MRHWARFCRCGLAVFFVAGFVMGCETSSRKTVRTYEYKDEPPPKRSQSDELDSEYKMQSEGEMVSPGEMVDE